MNEQEESRINRLIATMQAQTQAQDRLTAAISELAKSNGEVIDYLVSQQDDGDQPQAPETYLSGKPAR